MKNKESAIKKVDKSTKKNSISKQIRQLPSKKSYTEEQLKKLKDNSVKVSVTIVEQQLKK